VQDGEVVDLGDLAVSRGHRITGQVLDEQGAPVARAMVRIERHLAEKVGDDLDELIAGTLETRSDAHGRYELDGVSAVPLEMGRARLRAQADDQRASLPVEIPDADGSFDLTVHVTGTIEVAERPRSGMVIVAPPSGRPWLWGPVVDGIEHVQVPVGEYNVTLMNSDLSRPLAHARATVTPGEIVPVMLMEPSVAPVSVELHVATGACTTLELRPEPNFGRETVASVPCTGHDVVLSVAPGSYVACSGSSTVTCAHVVVADSPQAQRFSISLSP
jgi:hypothetical protein